MNEIAVKAAEATKLAAESLGFKQNSAEYFDFVNRHFDQFFFSLLNPDNHLTAKGSGVSSK